jgi:hypothetical protein
MVRAIAFLGKRKTPRSTSLAARSNWLHTIASGDIDTSHQELPRGKPHSKLNTAMQLS